MSDEADHGVQVSVCCAWYNRADHLRETLDGLLAQDHGSFEIVLVDDGSTDPRVAEILATYGDPRLRVIRQQNTGFVRAIANAVAASRGAYVAIHGAGDVSMPQRLSRQAAVLDADPRVGVVGSRLNSVVFGGPADGHSTASVVRKANPGLADFLTGHNPLSHGEVMIRRAFYDQVGGYRPFFRFAQDRDLWIRLATVCTFHIIDEVLYERRIFYKDGIGADRRKLLVQQAYSHFARQCHHDRQAKGRDDVDLFGENAALFRRPSGEFANYCARQALQSLAMRDHEGAAFFAGFARREAWTPVVQATDLLVKLCQRSATATRVLERVLSRHRNARRWTAAR